MRELLPGLFHWTTFHDGIGLRVGSYYVEPAGALIDPRVPDDGLDAFAGRTRPQQVVLTTGLHARHADRFADAFGCMIRASPQALERLGDPRRRDLQAMELHCPVIALSQLSRAVEQRTDQRPMLSDLRESGSIEADADIVLMLYRDDYYDDQSLRVGEIDILLRKNRHGVLGDLHFAWHPERIQPLAHRYSSPPLRVAALRRSSHEIVDAERPS